jgi:hypothetical protein
MAQADYVVANGTGAAVRSDLNGQLAAIVSNNSGATEPATMYAYQWWANTTTGLLLIRNAANSAWVTVGTLADANLGLLSLGGGTMTGALLADDSGTAALPAISFDGDSDTGIFRAGANELAVATNGVERVEFGTSEVVFNDGGANYDFRIEGDTNTSLFFVDASAEAVGIGTSSVSHKLHVFESSTAQNYIVSEAGSFSAVLGTQDSTGVAQEAFVGTLSNSDFKIKTNNSEVARFTTSGRLGIGSTSPAKKLDVYEGSTANVEQYLRNTTINLLSKINGTTSAQFGTETSHPLLLITGNSERARIDSSGRLLVGASAAVSGADANGRVQVSQDIASNTCILVAENTASSGNLSCIRAHLRNSSPNSIFSAFLQCDDSTTNRLTLRSNGGLANYSANNFNLSDRNAKKDISPAADTWDCIKEWEIVNYRYKDQSDDADLNLGVIAQQVAESCPEVITVFQEAKEATEDAPAQEERLGVREQQMYWMAIKALQEAQVRIEQLEAAVTALQQS